MKRVTAINVTHSAAAASFVLFAAAGAMGHAIAAEALPKSGSISVHSGYWAVGEAVTVAEKHVQGHGNNRGITFNDKGSGPLHLGPTDCFYTFYTAVDRTKVKGYCTFGDADGDRIFTDFSGAFQSDGYVQGMHDVDGGTGKYSGIQGSMTFKCKYSGGNGELECTQRLDYRLP
ncbi:MAG TPA: hypothetical protein VMH26_01455 [Burkholderiales bacterium]|nr:hypothetical protein [Burkholderiales bacterium]